MPDGHWVPAFICHSCASRLTGSSAGALLCRTCGTEVPLRDGIYRFLEDGRLHSLEPFFAQYRRIRGADGYRQDSGAYYRSLPHVDAGDPQAAIWRLRQESFRNLRRILRHFGHRPLRILDLGAGSGWLSAQLTTLGHTCVAVDWFDDREDGLGVQRNYPVRFTCLQADFDDLPIAPGQFDAAIFNASLHYANDPSRTLRHARTMLAPAGILMVMDSPVFRSDGAGRRMLDAQRIAFRSTGESIVSGGAGYLTKRSLTRTARDAGLAVQWIPSRGSLAWALKRWVAGVKQHRAPARFGIWLAVSHSASS